jgi:hypothetical protein
VQVIENQRTVNHGLLNQSIINYGLLKNFQNWLIEGSRLNHSGCRSQVK